MSRTEYGGVPEPAAFFTRRTKNRATKQTSEQTEQTKGNNAPFHLQFFRAQLLGARLERRRRNRKVT